MTEVSFYHLTHSRLDDALRALLNKALENDKNVLLLGEDEMQLKRLDTALWENPADSFLPHGLATDDAPETQPILLTNSEENQNNASFLFTLSGCSVGFLQGFERCFDIFDGNNERHVDLARKRWKIFAEQDIPLQYWKQDNNGKWEKAK